MKHEPSDYAATLQFLSSLVWPAFLLWLLWRFRRHIEQLLARLASLKVAGSEFVFQAPSDKPEKPSPTAKQAILELPANSFVSVSDLRTLVERSGLLKQGETLNGYLLLFQTPAQHTWLLATTESMFVVLDDAGTRRTAELIQTVIPRHKVLPIKIDVEDGAGIVRFEGEDTWWYYSRDLFPTAKSLRESIKTLVQETS